MKKDIWRAVTEIGFIIFLFLFQSFDGGIHALWHGARKRLGLGYPGYL